MSKHNKTETDSDTEKKKTGDCQRGEGEGMSKIDERD